MEQAERGSWMRRHRGLESSQQFRTSAGLPFWWREARKQHTLGRKWTMKELDWLQAKEEETNGLSWVSLCAFGVSVDTTCRSGKSLTSLVSESSTDSEVQAFWFLAGFSASNTSSLQKDTQGVSSPKWETQHVRDIWGRKWNDWSIRLKKLGRRGGQDRRKIKKNWECLWK